MCFCSDAKLAFFAKLAWNLHLTDVSNISVYRSNRFVKPADLKIGVVHEPPNMKVIRMQFSSVAW